MSILNFQQPNKILVHKTTDFNGTFEFSPLEQGFGVTIGNSLRRILLSSLEGIAVTGIKIEGVNHEFSTIPGVIEDVTDIILNLKQVRFKGKNNIQFNNEKVRITIQDNDKFTAKMISENSQFFEVIDPEFVICTLDKSTVLTIQLNLSKARGYVSAEENRPAEFPIGYIPIDSIHTPIINVKYDIENYRVEQRTDYEKLNFEITTDGTIKPEEAIKQAAKILIKHLVLISDENIASFDKPIIEPQVDVVDESLLQLKKILKKPLEDLDLSVRAFNCLKTARINSLSELVQYQKDDLLRFRNFGQKSLSEIEEMLKQRGLHFGMDLSKIGLND